MEAEDYEAAEMNNHEGETNGVEEAGAGASAGGGATANFKTIAEAEAAYFYVLDQIKDVQLDNDTLKSMLRRSPHGTEMANLMHAHRRLKSDHVKKCDELRDVKTKLRASESLLAKTKDTITTMQEKEGREMRRVKDMAATLRAENGILRDRHHQDEEVMSALRKLCNRMKDACHDRDLGEQYEEPPLPNNNLELQAATTRTERLWPKIPTNEPAAVKMTPTTDMAARKSDALNDLNQPKALTPTNSRPITSKSTTPFKRHATPPAGAPPDLLSQNPYSIQANGGGGGSGSSATPAPGSTDNVPYIVNVGERASWRKMNGTVRYLGPVADLGVGDWVGLELTEGRGDHDGYAFGTRFFEAPSHSSVFVHPSELQAPRHYSINTGGKDKDNARDVTPPQVVQGAPFAGIPGTGLKINRQQTRRVAPSPAANSSAQLPQQAPARPSPAARRPPSGDASSNTAIRHLLAANHVK